jgi:thiamine-phosphate pyrophosphorylase
VIRLPRPCLCLVTDRRSLKPDARTVRDEIAALEALLDEAIDAGIDLIQIRERDLDAALLRDLAVRTIARTRQNATRVLVNDRADVAVAACANGVHLRGDGAASSRVRELVGPDALIGRSIHDSAETIDAADFFLFGTVFPTGSKPADIPVAGPDGLAAAARQSTVPVLAIGGVTPARARACRQAGAAGIAAIGIFLPPGRATHALGPAAAITALRTAWNLPD